MRDTELINADWAVTNVMKGSPLVPEGSPTATTVRKGDRLLSYTPIKLGAACVACHARNGMQQKEGAYGDALLVEVWVR
jgi:mono/diheme cytochrome c family protein